MKKSAYIFTFHYSYNYGAFLQAFALQKIDDNFQMADLNRTLKVDSMSCIGYRGKKYLPIVWRLVSLFRYLKKSSRENRKKHFEEVNLLRFSRPFLSLSKRKIHNLFDGSIAICGSDQIWNPTFIMNRENIFFANIANFSKRIAYAASLGTKCWPDSFEKKAIHLLKRFDSISVREETSVKYLESLGITGAVCVCDPTILHKADFYRKSFSYERKKTENAFFYRIREHFPEKLTSLFPQKEIVDLKNETGVVSVTNWLKMIDNSKCVCTDSFHGTVFCLLFHKPFLVIPNSSNGKGMNERFATLLGKTHLEYRFLTCQETTAELLEKLNKSIDWDAVDLILDNWRNYSIEWLKNALGK